MYCKDNVLDLNNRKEIYSIIKENPGIHLREIERKTNIAFSTIRYHLKYLLKRELVIAKENKGFKRYYIPKTVGNGDKLIFNILRDEKISRILVVFLLCERKKVFFKEDLRVLPNMNKDYYWWDPWNYQLFQHRTTISYYLQKLIDIDFVEKVTVNGKTGYQLIDSEKIWDFLIKYENDLRSKKIKNVLRFTNNRCVPEVIKEFEDRYYEIFPHPYHL